MITLKRQSMKDGSTKLKLTTPYNDALVKRVRTLGGKWSGEQKAWYFPLDLEQELRDICVEIYGIDPLAETAADMVTVRYALNGEAFDKSLYLFGREILQRPFRDSDVRPGQDVSIVAGGFRPTGGSTRYPVIGDANPDTVLVIRNVPRQAALSLQEDLPEQVQIEEPVAEPDLAFRKADDALVPFIQTLKNLTQEQQEQIIHRLVTALQKEEGNQP